MHTSGEGKWKYHIIISVFQFVQQTAGKMPHIPQVTAGTGRHQEAKYPHMHIYFFRSTLYHIGDLTTIPFRQQS